MSPEKESTTTMSDNFDDAFRLFVGQHLPNIEAGYLQTGSREERRALQRDQIMRLLTAERAFQALLLAHPKLCREIYTRFLEHIEGRRGMLAARPFFRERQAAFTIGRSCCSRRRCPDCAGSGYVPGTSLGDVIRASDPDALAAYFRPNALFATFAMAQPLWSSAVRDTFSTERWWLSAKPKKKAPTAEQEAVRLTSEALALREQVILTNLALAVERSEAFWRRTQQSHLSRMDLLHHGVEGLASAVDKVVLAVRMPDGKYEAWDPADPRHAGLPFSREPGDALCATAVRRMTGNHIEHYSQTLMHFMPDDQRRLYRARKAAQYMRGKVVKCDCEEGQRCDKCGGAREYLSGSTQLDYEALAKAACEIKCQDCDGRGNGCKPCRGTGKKHSPDQGATPERIAQIMAAASCRPLITDEERDEVAEIQAPESSRPDVRLARAEFGNRVRSAISHLNPIACKTLIMSGVQLS